MLAGPTPSTYWLSTFFSPWLDNYQGSRFSLEFDLLFLIQHPLHHMLCDVFSIFMCQCVCLMLLLVFMFKYLKNVFILYFLMLPMDCCFFSIFSSMLLRSILDLHQVFVNTSFFNNGLNQWLKLFSSWTGRFRLVMVGTWWLSSAQLELVGSDVDKLLFKPYLTLIWASFDWFYWFFNLFSWWFCVGHCCLVIVLVLIRLVVTAPIHWRCWTLILLHSMDVVDLVTCFLGSADVDLLGNEGVNMVPALIVFLHFLHPYCQ